MADVDQIPKIRCDNCGRTTEKAVHGAHTSRTFHKPKSWGSMKAIGGPGSADNYGDGKSRLDFIDLCPKCAEVALQAAGDALAKARGEGFDGPTGAE